MMSYAINLIPSFDSLFIRLFYLFFVILPRRVLSLYLNRDNYQNNERWWKIIKTLCREYWNNSIVIMVFGIVKRHKKITFIPLNNWCTTCFCAVNRQLISPRKTIEIILNTAWKTQRGVLKIVREYA